MDFIRSLPLCAPVVYGGWPKGNSGETVFSHEESLTAGCSPEKPLSESSTEPEDWPSENTHNWLWGSSWPRSFESLSLCHDKYKLHPPPLAQKTFWAFRFLMVRLVLWWLRKEKDGNKCSGVFW